MARTKQVRGKVPLNTMPSQPYAFKSAHHVRPPRSSSSQQSIVSRKSIPPISSKSKNIKKSPKPKSICKARVEDSENEQIGLVLPRTRMKECIKEAAMEIRPDFRFSSEAIGILHEISEVYLVKRFQDANAIVQHSRRVTLMEKDIVLLKKLRGEEYDPL